MLTRRDFIKVTMGASVFVTLIGDGLGAISRVFAGDERQSLPYKTGTATWFKKGYVVLVGSRSEVEQSRFAYSAMRELTIEKKIPTAYLSPSIAKEDLSLELLAYMSGVQGTGHHSSTGSDWGRIATSAGGLAESPLYVHDAALIEVAQIRHVICEIKRLDGLDIGLVLVDYLQALGPMAGSEEVMQTVGYLKTLARNMNITIVAMTQAGKYPHYNQIKRLADETLCL
ncbi:MAG: DnaB-like helicase C-terminal domain-containing protein [Thermodesulfobacteriota bacterium]|nr:DnaB-like helicase C-terminal domain-containing protein [Thermodesulfobacteriota bacterium]